MLSETTMLIVAASQTSQTRIRMTRVSISRTRRSIDRTPRRQTRLQVPRSSISRWPLPAWLWKGQTNSNSLHLMIVKSRAHQTTSIPRQPQSSSRLLCIGRSTKSQMRSEELKKSSKRILTIIKRRSSTIEPLEARRLKVKGDQAKQIETRVPSMGREPTRPMPRCFTSRDKSCRDSSSWTRL
jgi:hypothetical protein